MIRHTKYTRTRYEFGIENSAGKRAFTLWFMERRPTLNKVYNLVVSNVDAIKQATGASDVIWNGDGTITAGEYIGKMIGETLLQARGYNK